MSALRLSDVLVLYPLDAMRRVLAGSWSHRDQRLLSDIEEYMSDMMPVYRRAMSNYLWAAALGEARHSPKFNGHGLDELYMVRDRDVASGIARGFGYTVGNADTVYSLFHDYTWDSGYGGRAWAHIVDVIHPTSKWAELPDFVWIDHVVDLQHNGGSVFDKYSAAIESRVSISGFEGYRLDDKANLDMTSKENVLRLFYGAIIPMKAWRLMSRFFGEQLPIATYRPPAYHVEFDNSILLVEAQQYGERCEHCGDIYPEDDMVYVEDYGMVCEYCLDSDAFHQCNYSGDWWESKHMRRVNGDWYAEWNAPEHASCDGCGHTFSTCDLTETRRGNLYCADCE